MNSDSRTAFMPLIRAALLFLVLGVLGLEPANAQFFRCDEGKAPHPKSGKCVPCGRKNQPVCEALRPGDHCLDYTQEINGICRARGGEGELQYQKGLGFIGYDCKPGFNKNPRRKGHCTACGGLNQPTCEVTRGKLCDKGLQGKTIGIFGTCVPDDSVERQLQAKAEEKIRQYLQEIVDIVIRALNENAQQARVRSSVRDYRSASANAKTKAVSAPAPVAGFEPLVLRGPNNAGMRSRSTTQSASAPQFGPFNSWTIGVGGGLGAGIGAEGENGLAFPFAMNANKAYATVSADFHLGFGGSSGVTVGLSTRSYDRQGGKSVGYKVSVDSVFEFVKGLKDLKQTVENFKQLGAAHPDISIGVWFEDNGGVGAFEGITATIGGAAGPNVGATYSRATTIQY